MNRLAVVLLLATVSLASSKLATGDVPDTTPASSEPVTVLVASGRVFVAEIDARTDESDLWLRWRRGAVCVLRPIQWDRVTQVRMLGETFTGDTVRRAVVAVRQRAAEVGQTRDNATSPPERRLTIVGSEVASAPSPAAEAAHRPRVTSLAVDANADNWDSDAEVDGLVVTIYPRDDHGRAIPVNGTLELQLVAPRPYGREGGVLLTRWTQRVLPSEFDSSGATYRLRFEQNRFDLEAHPYAELNARLVVPGEGVFEAIVPMVRVRPYRIVRYAR